MAWYRKAADQGNVAAQYNLGAAYANGLGVQQDDAEALKWYRKAADQGETDAIRIVREWKPGAGGRFSASDCLKVSGPIQVRRFLETAAPDLLAALTGHNVVLPNAAYLVFFQKGIDSGTFTFVRVLFAADFKLPNEAGGAVNLPAGVKPEAVAWGLALAEAVRSSIYSPSGTLLLPTVTTKEN